MSVADVLRNPRVWIAAVSLGVVVGIVASDLSRTAPGPISKVHAGESALTGLGSCGHCHGGWFGDMQQSCLECHEAIGEQIEARRGLHGRLGDERVQHCGACHGEHHGENFAIVNKLSFTLAGVPDAAKFDHAVVGFTMAGKHLELACAKCHVHAETVTLPKGERRYLGLSQDCQGCHDDAHGGRMQLACVECHGQTSWQELDAPRHDRHLPLTGGHAGVDCRECHAKDSPHSIEAAGERRRKGGTRKCQDCHESPHQAPFVAGAAKLAGKEPAAACGVCHLPQHTTFRDPGVLVTREQHAASGFRLDAPHHEVACAKCHAPERKEFAARYPGRGPDECRHCHEDVHRGEFEGKAFAVRGCIDCHARQQWKPHEFTVEKHAKTAFPLLGSHVENDCHECHRVAEGAKVAVFHGTKSRCDDCHADAHAGYFTRFARELSKNPAGTCAVCHVPTKFAERPAPGFAHGRWTGFEVNGAHDQAGCESCHPRAEQADANGRRFGRITETFGVYRGCVTCHQDVHQGQFDRADLPAQVGGQESCGRCHLTTSFRALRETPFDHGRWTGFVLTGAHRKAMCTSCHPPLAQPDEHGRTWARAKGAQCAACHKDNHAGQFDQDGKPGDCSRCHTGGARWVDLVFRHDVHSRFRLGEQHEKLPCAACHKPFRDGTREVIRYRPLPVECVDCHGSAKSPLRIGGGAPPGGSGVGPWGVQQPTVPVDPPPASPGQAAPSWPAPPSVPGWPVRRPQTTPPASGAGGTSGASSAPEPNAPSRNAWGTPPAPSPSPRQPETRREPEAWREPEGNRNGGGR